MPGPSFITVNGAVKINNLPDLSCFTSFEEFLKALPGLLTIEIPSTITNVVISNVQPIDSQTNSIWVRVSNGGEFIGLYTFTGGEWQQQFPIPDPGVNVYWKAGDSREIPEGYELVDNGNTQIDSTTVAHIMSQYLRDVTDTYWKYFAITKLGV